MSKRFLVRVLLATCLALLAVFSLAPGVFAQRSSNGLPLSGKNTPSWLQWHIVASSNAGPQNELTAIAALSGKDAWAVGDYHAPAPSLSKTLTEHWRGPATAVGYYFGRGNTTKTLVEASDIPL